MEKVTFKIGSFGDDQTIKSELIKAGVKLKEEYTGELDSKKCQVYFDCIDSLGYTNHCIIDADLCIFSAGDILNIETARPGKMPFTPGNWNYNSATYKIWSDIDVNDNNPIICDMSKHSNVGEEANKANAKLITAAPDMLSALEDAIRLIKYYQHKFITMEKEHDHAATITVNTLGRIVLAIEKATK